MHGVHGRRFAGLDSEESRANPGEHSGNHYLSCKCALYSYMATGSGICTGLTSKYKNMSRDMYSQYTGLSILKVKKVQHSLNL